MGDSKMDLEVQNQLPTNAKNTFEFKKNKGVFKTKMTLNNILAYS